MNNSRTAWLHAPLVDQRFTDESGRHWHVKAVIRSPGADGYYIVRVCYGNTNECAEGVSLLGRGEFAALCNDRKLRVTAPAGPPVPVLDTPSATAMGELPA